MNQDKIFNGLKVIELASVLAGPAAGMFFAELGAEVVKIENKKTGGDVTRSWKLPSENQKDEVSAYYSSVNWNKTAIFLDLTKNEEQLEVYEMIKTADIVIANYKPGKAEELKMDYERLKNINPSIIYAHISGYGNDSGRTAYDVVLQAESGYMSMNGQPGSLPTKMPVAMIDVMAAHQLKEGILTAIIKKMKTGRGSYVTVSLFESAVSSLANQATNWLMAGVIPTQNGSLHPNIAPYGEIFTTNDDKQFVLAVGTDNQFKALCEILNLKKLIGTHNFSTNQNRVKYREKLWQLLQERIALVDLLPLLNKLENRDVPAGVIRNIAQVFEDTTAQKLILEETTGNIRTKRVATVCFRIS